MKSRRQLEASQRELRAPARRTGRASPRRLSFSAREPRVHRLGPYGVGQRHARARARRATAERRRPAGATSRLACGRRRSPRRRRHASETRDEVRLLNSRRGSCLPCPGLDSEDLSPTLGEDDQGQRVSTRGNRADTASETRSSRVIAVYELTVAVADLQFPHAQRRDDRHEHGDHPHHAHRLPIQMAGKAETRRGRRIAATFDTPDN